MAATLVLLPGLPLTSEMFDAQVEALSSQHVIHRLDYPGFAGRELPTGLTFDDYVRFARVEVTQLPDSGPIVLVGISFGGQLALALAAEARDLVAGLVLSNTQGTGPTEQQSAMFRDLAAAAEAHGSSALVDQLTGLLLSEQTRAERPAVVARVRELIAAAPGAALASAFRALAGRPDPRGWLGRIDAPVLLAYGAADDAVPQAEADALSAGLADVEHAQLEGVGHFPSLEAPETYNAALAGFAARID